MVYFFADFLVGFSIVLRLSFCLTECTLNFSGERIDALSLSHFLLVKLIK